MQELLGARILAATVTSPPPPVKKKASHRKTKPPPKKLPFEQSKEESKAVAQKDFDN
jgi:hypothetical protein